MKFNVFWLALAVLAGMSTACRTHDGSSARTALETGYVTVSTIAPIGSGNEVGILLAPVVNVSSRPLTISGVDIEGPGIGDVVQVVETKLAPDGQGLLLSPAASGRPILQRNANTMAVIRRDSNPSMASFCLLEQEPRVWIVIRGIKRGLVRRDESAGLLHDLTPRFDRD